MVTLREMGLSVAKLALKVAKFRVFYCRLTTTAMELSGMGSEQSRLFILLVPKGEVTWRQCGKEVNELRTESTSVAFARR